MQGMKTKRDEQSGGRLHSPVKPQGLPCSQSHNRAPCPSVSAQGQGLPGVGSGALRGQQGASEAEQRWPAGQEEQQRAESSLSSEHHNCFRPMGLRGESGTRYARLSTAWGAR